MDAMTLIASIYLAQLAVTGPAPLDSARKAQGSLDCKPYSKLAEAEALQGRLPLALGDVINKENDIRLIFFVSKIGEWTLVAERPTTHVACVSTLGIGWTMGAKAVAKKLPKDD